MTETTEAKLQDPNFLGILDPKDQEAYFELRSQITSKDLKFRRNRRIESFLDAIDAIRAYAKKNDSNDWKRFLVCGICFSEGGAIAINTRQLRILTGKCKSSINGALAKMGYATKTELDVLLQAIPYLRGNFPEQRQWSVRTLASHGSNEAKVTSDSAFPKYEPLNIPIVKSVTQPVKSDKNINQITDEFLKAVLPPEMKCPRVPHLSGSLANDAADQCLYCCQNVHWPPARDVQN